MENPDIQIDPVAAASMTLEAFLDGETVERAALRDALADEGAREHFLDLLVLRGGIAALGPAAWSAPQPARRYRTRWWTAAAVVVLSLAAGFVAGQRTVDATAFAAVEMVGPARGARAPKPTRVISLEPGVNWKESAQAGGR